MADIEGDGDTYTFTCLVPRCGFQSTNHDTKKAARERRKEHLKEHQDGEPMREIGAHQAGQTQEEFEDTLEANAREQAKFFHDDAEVNEDADRSE